MNEKDIEEYLRTNTPWECKNVEPAFSGYEEDDMTLTNEEIDEALTRVNKLLNMNPEMFNNLYGVNTKTILKVLEMAKRNRWMPIETMPKTGIYLVCQGDSVPTCINARLYWEERPDTPNHLRFDHFTHWMPLPKPPKSEG